MPTNTMKNTRSRRPDHVRVIGADVCEAPNPQPEASYKCHLLPWLLPRSCFWFSPLAILTISLSASFHLLQY
jgi:hypothetical protein